METLGFRVVLRETELTEAQDEALIEAGCDDGTIWSSEDMTAIDFDREGESLDQATRSAIADVQKAGCSVANVVLDPETVAELGRATEATGPAKG